MDNGRLRVASVAAVRTLKEGGRREENVRQRVGQCVEQWVEQRCVNDYMQRALVCVAVTSTAAQRNIRHRARLCAAGRCLTHLEAGWIVESEPHERRNVRTSRVAVYSSHRHKVTGPSGPRYSLRR